MQQADLYTASINQKIIDASTYPQAGSPLGDVKGDYRKLVAGNHRIIYRFTDEQLIVVRILHERQDMPPDADS